MPTDPHLLLYIGCTLHVLPYVAAAAVTGAVLTWLGLAGWELTRPATGRRRKVTAPVIDGDHGDVPARALQKLARGLTAASHLPKRKQVER